MLLNRFAKEDLWHRIIGYSRAKNLLLSFVDWVSKIPWKRLSRNALLSTIWSWMLQFWKCKSHRLAQTTKTVGSNWWFLVPIFALISSHCKLNQ